MKYGGRKGWRWVDSLKVSEGLTLADVENELEVTQTISSSYMKTRLSTSDFTPTSLLTLILCVS